tara:strand:+ start:3306 stop:3707 length:402 start_codon:yes stop_codon:yes gene_type:complete
MRKTQKTRKSLIDEYKAKARGKKTSKVSSKGRVKKLKKPVVPTRIPITDMTVGDMTYSKGDIAWYVLEADWQPNKPVSGEILECHPNDKIEPSISVFCDSTKCYRTIRASLVAWDKAEAKKRWENFLKKTGAK